MRATSAPHFPVEERIARFRSFYQRANERPLLGFFVGSDYPLRRYRASDSLPSDRPLKPEDFPVGPYLDDCDQLSDLHEACGGDFIWSASAFWGIPWLEAALLSPALYDEFICEHDDHIARAFDGCIMHQHPTKFVPTDFYLRMPFLALELHIDEGGPGAEALHSAHLKILAQKPLVIWGNIPERDLDWLFRKLPPAGLAVITVVPSPERAGEIWRRCFN